MEKMKYFIFYREDNNFHDILNDSNLKRLFRFKLQWTKHLILGSDKLKDKTQSYILLKYGDDVKNVDDVFPDRKPIPGHDYRLDPKRPEKFKNI